MSAQHVLCESGAQRRGGLGIELRGALSTLELMKAKEQMKLPKQGVLLKGSAPRLEPEQLQSPPIQGRGRGSRKGAGRTLGVGGRREEEHQRVWWPGFQGGCGLSSVSKEDRNCWPWPHEGPWGP